MSAKKSHTNPLPTWIDGDDAIQVGYIGFLVRTIRRNDGDAETWSLHGSPMRTNQSCQPRLTGWCGETNNISYYAHGMARVTRCAANGRVRIAQLCGADLAAALEAAGYPEITTIPQAHEAPAKPKEGKP